MVFSQVGRYPLRIMAVLASQPEGALLRAKDLTESTRVPAAYLSKVDTATRALRVGRSEKD